MCEGVVLRFGGMVWRGDKVGYVAGNDARECGADGDNGDVCGR